MVFVLITGRPGIGKTTLFFKVLDILRRCGITYCGFYCPEVREGNSRIGFKLVDLVDGSWTWLALRIDLLNVFKVNSSSISTRIGRYYVLIDAEKHGIKALSKCTADTALMAIDEIGPMELSLPNLRKAILDKLSKAKNALLVIHRNIRDNDFLKLFQSKNAKTYVVTMDNRKTLHIEILRDFAESLGVNQCLATLNVLKTSS